MNEETKSVYVGFQAFSVTGDPMDDAILDAIVERLEVNPADVSVYEKDDSFFVFIHSLNLSYQLAMDVLQESKHLSETYDLSVAKLTKMIRRVDKYHISLNQLQQEVNALNNKKEELLRELETSEENKKNAQLELSKIREQLQETL